MFGALVPVVMAAKRFAVAPDKNSAPVMLQPKT